MSNLSDRATESLQQPIDPTWTIATDRYYPKTNPSGYVNLGVAENTLMQSELKAKLRNSLRSSSWELSYGEGPGGSRKLRRSLASFINRHFKPVIPVLPEHISASYGVSASLQRCAFALGDLGDYFLLGRPYYASFAHELGHRAGIRILPVAFGAVDPFGIGSVACYEEELVRARLEGKTIRALLLCNPHNPIGRCYPRETLVELMKLCQRHHLHLVVDEIYALSTWENPDYPDAAPFMSILSIATAGIIGSHLVHVLWGLSKDFGANGLRVGCMISQSNREFLNAATLCAPEGYTSPLLERMAIEILDDVPFTEWYIVENRRRLEQRHTYIIGFLKKHGIPFRSGGNAGFFVWADLGSYWRRACHERIWHKRKCSVLIGVDEASSTGEISHRLLQHKVYVNDGDSFGSETPGWFRIVYTQPLSELQEGLTRMLVALNR